MSATADFCLKVSPDSLIAFVHESSGRVRVIKDGDGNEKTEYYIAFTNNSKEKVVVGEGAKEYLKTHPKSVVYDFFELLGLMNGEVYVTKAWKFIVYELENDGVEVGYEQNEKLYRMDIKHIVAVFLSAIKKNVEKSLGVEVRTVKIHIQLGITGAQKAKFLQAIQLIGLTPV